MQLVAVAWMKGNTSLGRALGRRCVYICVCIYVYV